MLMLVSLAIHDKVHEFPWLVIFWVHHAVQHLQGKLAQLDCASVRSAPAATASDTATDPATILPSNSRTHRIVKTTSARPFGTCGVDHSTAADAVLPTPSVTFASTAVPQPWDPSRLSNKNKIK